jgi:membrane protease YdiL (CAAX protease family)
MRAPTLATGRVAPATGRPSWAPFAVYLAGLGVAELAVTYVNPLLVFPLHGGLIALVAAYLAYVSRVSTDPVVTLRLRAFAIAFTLGPLIRIISLTLPMGSIESPYRYVAAGVPMLVGGIVAARAIGFGRRDLGLFWRATGVQVAVIAVSIGVGVLEYAILHPQPIAPLPWQAGGVAPALAVALFTGFPEELIFRGLMQTAARPLLGRWNWVYVAAVFAVLHIGYQSAADVLFVFGVGLLYGWVTERTRSILGVSAGHGLANVVLLCIAPNLLG